MNLKALTHKHVNQNVFISDYRIDDDVLVVDFTPNLEHPYFFEHPQDHVPGMMVLEGVRQACLCYAHTVLGIPLEEKIVIDSISPIFSGFVELDERHTIEISMISSVRRQVTLAAVVKSEAGEHLVASTLTGTRMSNKVYERVRRVKRQEEKKVRQ
jgi:hypothetical protein